MQTWSKQISEAFPFFKETSLSSSGKGVNVNKITKGLLLLPLIYTLFLLNSSSTSTFYLDTGRGENNRKRVVSSKPRAPQSAGPSSATHHNLASSGIKKSRKWLVLQPCTMIITVPTEQMSCTLPFSLHEIWFWIKISKGKSSIMSTNLKEGIGNVRFVAFIYYCNGHLKIEL